MDRLLQRSDLVIGVAEWLPEGFEAEARKELAKTGVEPGVFRLSDGPYGSIELYMPSAVGLFIMGAFFTGFFGKAGEDSYEALKSGSRALYRKASELRVRIIGSRGKARETGFSSTFAIGCELLPSLRAKLLIRSDAPLAEVEAGIEAFIDLMASIHAGHVGEAELQDLLKFRPVGGTFLVTYDAGSGRIIPVDGMAQVGASPHAPNDH
jgi:hypothetical protein